MIKGLVRGKVYVFIDAANLNIGLRRYKKSVDFKKLARFFRRQSKETMLFYYTYDHPKDKKHQRFLTFLKIQGFRLRTKQVKIIKDKKKGEERKANFDVEIAIDAVDKQTIICSTRRNISRELWERGKFIDVLTIREILRPYKNATSHVKRGSGNQ